MAAQPDAPLDALLVGYEDQENLGLRSIMAYLLARGYRATLVPFCPGREDDLVAVAERMQPRLIGFSVIFQYALDEFAGLMRCMREAGIRSHFTAGGHFPSLCPKETLGLAPELDSVVCFEGEETLTELLGCLEQPSRWHEIRGLAFRGVDTIVVNPPRPLIADLDQLPPVFRDEPRTLRAGVRVASMLASRGCLFNCSFCSIRRFYASAPGELRRVRSPQAVVEEMAMLYREKDVRLFLFQDDDFAARTSRQRQWLAAFLDGLTAAGLAHQVRWKISCRVDDLGPEILDAMLNHGLVAVYLGVESGSEQGLRALNKRVTVAMNRAAIDLLKSRNAAIGIGFMLFDPSSTIETVRENLDFLKAIGGDGYFPINFCKMLPYAGTAVETELRAAGRLKGTVTQPDYDFLDPKLDAYAYLVKRIFARRNFFGEGIVARLTQADFEHRLARSLRLGEPLDAHQIALRTLIGRSNRLAIETLNALLDTVVTYGSESFLEQRDALVDLAEQEWQGEARVEAELDALLTASD